MFVAGSEALVHDYAPANIESAALGEFGIGPNADRHHYEVWLKGNL